MTQRRGPAARRRVTLLGAGTGAGRDFSALRAAENHETADRARRATPGAQRLVIADFPSPDVARALSPNGRAHWTTQRAARQAVASRVVVEATRAGLRPVDGPVRLTFRYVFPVRRTRDVDNWTSGVTKAAIDALVRGRWIAADDSEHVMAVTVEPAVERGRRRLEIALTPA